MAKNNVTATPVTPVNRPKLVTGSDTVQPIQNPPIKGDATTPGFKPGENPVGNVVTASTKNTATPAAATSYTMTTGHTMRDAYSDGSGGYTTINEQVNGDDGIGREAYLENERETYDPNAVKAMTPDELNALIAQLGADPSQYDTGGYVRGEAGEQGKLPGTGEQGWVYQEGDPRNKIPGTSGADEDLLGAAGYAAIQALKAEWEKENQLALEAEAAGKPEEAAQHRANCKAINNQANQIRASMGYYGGTDGSMYVTLGELGVEQPSQKENLPALPGSGGTGNTGTGASGSKEAELHALLEQWKEVAEKQANGQIDYAVEQAIKELERALEDAQPQFKETAESISLEERQAMDNSALYAELRGDRGGIGQEQYNSIQNTAAQNRLAVQQAQTKLSTDTARQIADLRAQGEFEKADKALEITQQYLAQLITLEQWAAEFNFSQEQFQASLKQWEAEYQLALDQFGFQKEQTGIDNQYRQDAFEFEKWLNEQQLQLQRDEFNYGKELDAWQMGQTEKNELAQMGFAWLEMGRPDLVTEAQLKAMGMSKTEAEEYSKMWLLTNGSKDSDGKVTSTDVFNAMYSYGFDSTSDSKAMMNFLKTEYPGMDEDVYRAYIDRYVGGEYRRTMINDLSSGGGWGPGFDDTNQGGKASPWAKAKSTLIKFMDAEDYEGLFAYLDQNRNTFSEEQWMWVIDQGIEKDIW